LGKKELTQQERFDKRKNEITRAINHFKMLFGRNYDDSQFSVLEDAGYLITKLYASILYPEVKEFIDDKAVRFKIASLTELCIISIQPFRSKNVKLQREMNAQVAFYVAIGIFASMDTNSFERSFAISPLEDFFEDIKRKHLEWLSIKKTNMMCIISNEHTLELMHEFYNFRWATELPV